MKCLKKGIKMPKYFNITSSFIYSNIEVLQEVM